MKDLSRTTRRVQNHSTRSFTKSRSEIAFLRNNIFNSTSNSFHYRLVYRNRIPIYNRNYPTKKRKPIQGTSTEKNPHPFPTEGQKQHKFCPAFATFHSNNGGRPHLHACTRQQKSSNTTHPKQNHATTRPLGTINIQQQQTKPTQAPVRVRIIRFR